MIWLDESRARAQLEAARLAHDVIAMGNGAKSHQLPDWEDPADAFEDPGDDTTGPGGRARDPAERAAQIAAFIAAAGGESAA